MCFVISQYNIGLCGTSPGGLTKIWVASKKSILTFPKDFRINSPIAPTTIGQTTTPITMVGSDKFVEIGFLADNAGYDFKIGGEPGNNYVEQSLKVIIGKYSPEHFKMIEEMLGNEMIFAAEALDESTDTYGLLVFGTGRRGLHMDADHKGGSKFSDKKETTFTFKGGFPHAPFFYNAVLPI
jgi:hypothetical protein